MYSSLLDSNCVAIIVPYCDIHPKQNRAKHLSKFIPHMHAFMQKQLQKGTISDYHIYIIEQSNDNRKFNRGKLLNIGFDVARKNKCRNHTTTSSSSSSTTPSAVLPTHPFPNTMSSSSTMSTCCRAMTWGVNIPNFLPFRCTLPAFGGGIPTMPSIFVVLLVLVRVT